MSVRLGDIPIGELRFGDIPIAEAYLGDVLVYRKENRPPYLEIVPDLIWVNPEWGVDNDVLSNVTWNIN